MQAVVPTVYFPKRGIGEQPEPVPYVLTESEMIRLARLDEAGTEKPDRALARYRALGVLVGVQVGPVMRYTLPDALEFFERLKANNPR